MWKLPPSSAPTSTREKLEAGRSLGSRNGTLMASVMRQAVDSARRADHRVDAAREVQERRSGERQPGRSKRVDLDRRVGRLQQPRRMSDLGADEVARAPREEAVALDQPFLERTALGRNGGPDRLVARDERAVRMGAGVVDAGAVPRDDHVGA